MVRISDQWIVLASDGKVIARLEVKMDRVFDYSHGLAKFEFNGRYGFLDPRFNVYVPAIYAAARDFREGVAAVAIAADSNAADQRTRWGYVDTTGRIVIEARFEEAHSFHEGLAAIAVDGRFGYIDHDGRFAIQPSFIEAREFDEGLALVRHANKKYGFIDRAGHFAIPPIYDDASFFSEGLARVLAENDRYGFIDRSGSMVIPAIYYSVDDFHDGLAQAMMTDDDYKRHFGGAELKKRVALGYIDRAGRWIIPPKYDEFVSRFIEGRAVLIQTEGVSIIDPADRVIVPAGRFRWIRDFIAGLAPVQFENGRWGYIDTGGRIVIEPRFDEVGDFSEGVAFARIVDQWRLIDTTGRELWRHGERVDSSRVFRFDLPIGTP